MDPEAIQRYLERMEEIIQRHGWMVQAVFPTADDPSHHFQYTIGLHDRGLPELIVIGLPANVGQPLLNDVGRVVAQRQTAGEPLVGKVDHENWPMPFFLIDADKTETEKLASGARNRSEGEATYLQVCWPDAQGRFPWDPDITEEYLEAQPPLGLPVLPS